MKTITLVDHLEMLTRKYIYIDFKRSNSGSSDIGEVTKKRKASPVTTAASRKKPSFFESRAIGKMILTSLKAAWRKLKERRSANKKRHSKLVYHSIVMIIEDLL